MRKAKQVVLPGDISEERLRALAGEGTGMARAVAAHPRCPSETLERLASHQDREVKLAVARNPNTPGPLLLKMLRYYPLEVLQNPSLPMLLLESPGFFAQASENALESLFLQDSLPEFVLYALALHPEVGVRSRVASYQVTPIALLTQLSEAEDLDIRRSVAANPSAPEELLQKLARDPHDEVRGCVANQRTLSPALFEILSQDRTHRVSYTLATREDTPREILERILQSESAQARAALIPRGLRPLRYFCDDPSFIVRDDVARSSEITLEEFLLLAKDESSYVKCTLARREDIPEVVLQKLLEDDDAEVREYAVRNPKLTTEMILARYQDPSLSVRVGVASQRKNLPFVVREAFSRDPEEFLRTVIASHPLTPEQVARLARDPSARVRAEIASAQPLSEELQSQLYQDSGPFVRRALFSNPHLPESFLLALLQRSEDRRELAASRTSFSPRLLAAISALSEEERAEVASACKFGELRFFLDQDPSPLVQKATKERNALEASEDFLNGV